MHDDKAADVEITPSDQEGQNGNDENTGYSNAWHRAILTLALCLGVLCVALDNTIVTTVIPRITDDFKSVGEVGWYASSYLLTTCAFQLFFGRLYTFYPIKHVYLCALLIFELGSAVCGSAPNSVAFIFGRAVAGLGSAGIYSGALLIIAHTVRLEKRPIHTSLIGGMFTVASITGPLMGGVLTDHVSWRWCFFINLPLGFATAGFVIVFFSGSTETTRTVPWREQADRLDLLGALFMVPAIICLLLVLQWGGVVYTWTSWRIILLITAFGVLGLIFGRVQVRKQENATIPPRIFKQRNVWASAVFAVNVAAAFYCMVYYIPIWFQSIKGVSAMQSGLMILPLMLGIIIMLTLSGMLTTKVGYYTPFCFASAVFMAVGAGLCSTFTKDTRPLEWISYQFIFGAGIGFGTQQPLIAVQTVLPLADIPTGTAIVMFSQMLGGSIFVSVGQNVFSNQLVRNFAQYVPELAPDAILRFGATELRQHFDPTVLTEVLMAYNDTVIQIFYVSAGMAALAILPASFLDWKSVKTRGERRKSA